MTRKILFLHGWTQSDQAFRKKTAVIRKCLEPDYECYYANGTLIGDSLEHRSWWNAVQVTPTLYEYQGLNQSIQNMQSLWSAEFCGIFGFSQGATFANILAPLLDPKPVIGKLHSFLSFLFLDFFREWMLYARKLPICPCCTLLGTCRSPRLSDDIVPPEATYKLAEYTAGQPFESAKRSQCGKTTILTHPGGHLVPGQAEYRHFIWGWIKEKTITPSL
jgi:hypothetical protein